MYMYTNKYLNKQCSSTCTSPYHTLWRPPPPIKDCHFHYSRGVGLFHCPELDLGTAGHLLYSEIFNDTCSCMSTNENYLDKIFRTPLFENLGSAPVPGL